MCILVPLARPGGAVAATTLFSDGFESGAFAAWSVVKTGADGTATVQSSGVRSGRYAARLSETSAAGSYAYASATLAAAQSDLMATGDFDVTVEGYVNSNVRLFRLFDGSGVQVASVYRQNQTSQLGVQYGGAYYVTSGKIALNAWATVALHVVTAGSGASTVQVWLNGSQVYQTTTASLGTAGVLTAQIGNTTPSQPSAEYVDNVSLTTNSTASATSTPTVGPTNTPAPPTPTSTTTDTPVPATATNAPAPPTATASPTVTGTPAPNGTPAVLIQNGSFEDTGPNWLAPWSFTVGGGTAATIGPNPAIRGDGVSSAAITVTQAAASSSAVQLAQGGLTLTGGQKYIISFFAQSTVTGTVQATLQQGGASSTVVWNRSASVGPGLRWRSSRSLTYTYTPATTQANVTFALKVGTIPGPVWVDSVVIAPATTIAVPTSTSSAPDAKGVSWLHPAEYWGSNHAGIDTDLADMNMAGITWARVDLDYSTAPNPNFDYVVQAAQQHHIHLLARVWDAPPGNDIGTDQDRATYRAWLAQMVARYDYWIKDWEIHNEPNLHEYWNIDESPSSDPTAYAASAHRYVLHLQDSYPTIKSVDPTATVVMGAVDEWTEERFIYQLIQEKADQYFDVLAVHPYENNPDADVGRLQALEARLAAQPGWAAKPLWVTEVGFNTTWTYHVGYVSSEQQKADYLTQTLPALRANGAQLPIFWYTLHENTSASGYGLEHKDPSTLQTTYFPAFSAYQSLALN
jgi:hypothetical protein